MKSIYRKCIHIYLFQQCLRTGNCMFNYRILLCIGFTNSQLLCDINIPRISRNLTCSLILTCTKSHVYFIDDIFQLPILDQTLRDISRKRYRASFLLFLYFLRQEFCFLSDVTDIICLYLGK